MTELNADRLLATQKTLAQVGNALIHLAEDETLVAEMVSAVHARDGDRFHEALRKLPGFDPWEPGDCIDFVETIAIWTPATFGLETKWVCRWVATGQIITEDPVTVFVAAGGGAQKPLTIPVAVLVALGLATCGWETVIRKEGGLITESITKKLCPGPKPSPGPDPLGRVQRHRS